MRFALIQPNWSFKGSTYFGCRETHIPLELLYSLQQLNAAGQETMLVDAHLESLTPEDTAARLRGFAPDVLVLTTAPTYLFWRCPQPELRLPAEWMRSLREQLPSLEATIAIGPHGSATPQTTLRKLDCDVVVQGEPDQVLPLAANDWTTLPGSLVRTSAGARANPGVNQTDMRSLGPMDWSGYPLALRRHRHHVFSGDGRGAELEASRGCPWSCTFCNKTLFRNQFRERPLNAILADAEFLVRSGFDYIYFIDEIFGCGRQTTELLTGLEQLPLRFGIQTRIDLWNEDSLQQLGRAGCISLECGIESITAEGRARFRKGCRLDNDRIVHLLQAARRHIPWVQANLIADDQDDLGAINLWRHALISDGVWVSQPVPVFPFPGTPLYERLFGPPDDNAWERAHRHYLAVNHERRYYSDVQDAAPQPLKAIESL